MAKNNPISIEYRSPVNGRPVRPIAKGLFTMHDQEGFSLMDSIWLCRQKHTAPDLLGFVWDSTSAGWSFEKAKKVIEQAVNDVDGPENVKLVGDALDTACCLERLLTEMDQDDDVHTTSKNIRT